jgi:hypothetical protein
LLVPGGRLLVWRNVFGDPSVRTPFRDRVDAIVRQREAPLRPGPDAEDVDAVAAALTRDGLFAVEDTAVFRWTIQLDEARVRRLFATFSNWSPAEVDRAAAAVGGLGGSVVEHYQSWLLVLSSPAAVRHAGRAR